MLRFSIIVSFFILPLLCVWFTTCLAETNRTPFDLAEGESEIVSGLNVEYRATPFAFIFMAEYINIVFMRTLTIFLFTGLRQAFFSSAGIIVLNFIFIWVRGALPRIRYDILIRLTWKSLLPFSLASLVFVFIII